MIVPPGFEESYGTNKVCTLKKSLYELKKRSPRAWFGKFTKTMKMLGYRQCNGDYTPFFKHPQIEESQS